MLQWHHEAVSTGDVRSDLWFAYHLGRRIREKLDASADEMDHWYGPHLGLPSGGPLAELSAEADGRINGWDGEGKLLSSYTQLTDDGPQLAGCWITVGPRRRRNWAAAASRDPSSWWREWARPLPTGGSWYNGPRRPDGKPWSSARRWSG
jgi:formate dehydrogenase major subunit